MDKRIEESLDILDLLNAEHREISLFVDIELKRYGISIIEEYKRWNEGSGNIPKEQRGQFFKDSTVILNKLVDRYVFMTKQAKDSEDKAIYWKLKYQSVKADKELQEKLYENLNRLLEENEQLKAKYNN